MYQPQRLILQLALLQPRILQMTLPLPLIPPLLKNPLLLKDPLLLRNPPLLKYLPLLRKPPLLRNPPLLTPLLTQGEKLLKVLQAKLLPQALPPQQQTLPPQQKTSATHAISRPARKEVKEVLHLPLPLFLPFSYLQSLPAFCSMFSIIFNLSEWRQNNACLLFCSPETSFQTI